MLTTKFSPLWHPLINPNGFTNTPQFYEIFPKVLRMRKLCDRTVCEFVNEDMENLVRITIKTYSYVRTLVDVISDSSVHSFQSCYGDGAEEHFEFFIFSRF